MELSYPALARLSCSECKEWMIDTKTWTKELHRGKPFKRAANCATPCAICPRKGPSHEAESRLSERNNQTIELYRKFRACGWDSLPPACRTDSILTDNFTLIDRIIRQQEQSELGQAMASAMLPFFASKKT